MLDVTSDGTLCRLGALDFLDVDVRTDSSLVALRNFLTTDDWHGVIPRDRYSSLVVGVLCRQEWEKTGVAGNILTRWDGSGFKRNRRGNVYYIMANIKKKLSKQRWSWTQKNLNNNNNKKNNKKKKNNNRFEAHADYCIICQKILGLLT